MPSALAALLPQAEIDVVENDPSVMRVAQDYFHFTMSPRLRVHEANGRVLLEQMKRDQRRFDLVMLDAFNSTTSRIT